MTTTTEDNPTDLVVISATAPQLMRGWELLRGNRKWSPILLIEVCPNKSYIHVDGRRSSLAEYNDRKLTVRCPRSEMPHGALEIHQPAPVRAIPKRFVLDRREPPAFVRLDQAGPWLVLGTDDVVKLGDTIPVSRRSDGATTWLMISRIIADRVVTHRDRASTRFVIAEFTRTHWDENCPVCLGKLEPGTCDCPCHGKTFVRRALDGPPTNTTTWSERAHAALHALTAAAHEDPDRKQYAVDQAVRALAGEDYPEFVELIEQRGNTTWSKGRGPA